MGRGIGCLYIAMRSPAGGVGTIRSCWVNSFSSLQYLGGVRLCVEGGGGVWNWHRE